MWWGSTDLMLGPQQKHTTRKTCGEQSELNHVVLYSIQGGSKK